MNKDEEKLCEAIVSIKTVEECKKFLHDLCTPSEIEEFSSRWLIARLLSTKKSYREIASQLGASTATVTREARFLFNENNEGYKSLIKKQWLVEFGLQYKKMGDCQKNR